MNKKQILDTIKNFVHGEINAKEIYELYNENADVRELINNFNHVQVEFISGTFENFFKKFNYKNPSQVFDLAELFTYLLYSHGTLTKAHEKYLKEAEDFLKIYPDWLHDGAIDYIEKFVEPNMPEGLSEKQISTYIKKQIKALFKYENKKPEFLQSGYWPLDEDNKPLLFQKQINEGAKATYYFIDPKTGKQETLEEFS